VYEFLTHYNYQPVMSCDDEYSNKQNNQLNYYRTIFDIANSHKDIDDACL